MGYLIMTSKKFFGEFIISDLAISAAVSTQKCSKETNSSPSPPRRATNTKQYAHKDTETRTSFQVPCV